MTNIPRITFIICTYNRADYLDDTLHSLLRPDYPFSDFELLVVDNNSTDRTPEIVAEHQKNQDAKAPLIQYVQEKKQGLSHARNRGIQEADAPYIVFVDDDVRATEEFIPSWILFFQDHPDANAAGGKIHVQFDDPCPDWMSHFLLPLLGRHDHGESIKRYGKLNYPFGGNMGFRKSLFDQVGLFHTDLGRKGAQLKASEEKELFQRLKKQGIPIYYIPDALLYHRVNKDRLTKDYIRRQALGLGQSIALQLNKETASKKLKHWMMEVGKILVTAGLVLPYSLAFQGAKAVMLVKFRKWIMEGYFSVTNGGNDL